MDRINIPDDQVTSLDDIAEGVAGLRIVFVNVFSIADGNGSWTLIDAGLPLSGALIRRWAEKRFSRPPNAIVLTHGHFDHVSAAAGLAKHWDVPIFAHDLEFPFLTGQQAYPAPNPGAGGGLMSLLSPTYPRDPIDVGDRLRRLPVTKNAVGALVELRGWEIIHTPGHTPGHVSLFRSTDGTLLPGDAFCTTKPESFFEAALAQQPELHGPPSYFTWDWELARQSVQQLATLNAKIVAPGHGKPLSGSNVPEALRQLAANFNEVSVPENRKTGAGV